MYLPCSDSFGTKRNYVWCRISRKSVITIQILFYSTRFRKYFFVYRFFSLFWLIENFVWFKIKGEYEKISNGNIKIYTYIKKRISLQNLKRNVQKLNIQTENCNISLKVKYFFCRRRAIKFILCLQNILEEGIKKKSFRIFFFRQADETGWSF